jgi:hypothetical protein
VQKYTFTVQLVGQVQEAPRSATLRDDAAALGFACDMARELRNSGRCHDPNLMIKVGDENRQIIFSIPGRAGWAYTSGYSNTASRSHPPVSTYVLCVYVPNPSSVERTANASPTTRNADA